MSPLPHDSGDTTAIKVANVGGPILVRLRLTIPNNMGNSSDAPPSWRSYNRGSDVTPLACGSERRRQSRVHTH